MNTAKAMHSRFWGYGGRFIVIHLLVYVVFAALFWLLQGALPEANRTALDFFQPYRQPGFQMLLGEGLRAVFLSAILYPFYDLIVNGRRGGYILFGALWGLALLGSLEPIPGSIEGMIYTRTSGLEHILVLGTAAVQVTLFCLLFLRRERRAGDEKAMD